MGELLIFTDEFKRKKLEKITNLLARNIVSQLLTRDFNKRPNFDQVISHDIDFIFVVVVVVVVIIIDVIK